MFTADNKVDRDDREIPTEIGEEFANRHGMYFLETSAKSSNNVEKLFTDLGPRFKARAGGYTRILKMEPRPGDSADMALMQLVDLAPVAAEKTEDTKPAKSSKAPKKSKKAAAADGEAEAAAAAPKRRKAKAA